MTDESRIIVPKTAEETKDTTELKYNATETDEEKFFLMYNLNWSPSEVDSLSEDRRKWIIARFVGQRQMEREAMQQMQIRDQIMPNMRA